MNTKKKKTLLLFAILFSCFQAEAKKLKGIIYTENDSMEVVFEVPFRVLYNEPAYEQMQYSMTYVDKNKRIKYVNPDTVKEIRFMLDGEQVRLISKFNTLELENFLTLISKKNKVFLKLEVDGELQLFTCYDKIKTGNSTLPNGQIIRSGDSFISTRKYVMQRGNGELRLVRDLYFRSDILHYFKDCPMLVNQIEKEKVTEKDLKGMVKYYNKYCTSSNLQYAF